MGGNSSGREEDEEEDDDDDNDDDETDEEEINNEEKGKKKENCSHNEEETSEKNIEKYRKMAEETYRKKLEERYKKMTEEEPRHIPQPLPYPNNCPDIPPQLTEEQFIQLLKMLPPEHLLQLQQQMQPQQRLQAQGPINRMQEMPSTSNGEGGGFPFGSPEEMLQFMKFINERQNMNQRCGQVEVYDEGEGQKKSIIKNMFKDITKMSPMIWPAVPPLLMMFIGTQKTYLILYTLSLIQDAFNFVQKIRN
ncbi:Plasmodium exported protein, unknown function [Plasmodium malariae]|nr:Plasmodium exported protein, unknown function [Plasmodium malariae]SBT86607.1 Plasmodium exported protein, unknown function [Plasmodium malariae]